MTDDTNRIRRRLIAGGAGALAAVGFGTLSRAALAQAATIELPFVNGKRNIVAFPEKRPLIVLTSRPHPSRCSMKDGSLSTTHSSFVIATPASRHPSTPTNV